ncbi:S8 family serine peptidase [Asticcacaulis sp. AND118]|uniref:S8 family serine peptidase n=1 Tax=Asticcacaulis sp. AND118 TaxID=2840468 RepID=UPI001D000F4F|nr:S8 family serine peptidase [Asticcacaulis sp. AND118]UDF05016.1 S8 family serine peptidase [Asticcacaulis sp. AND118]
MPLKHLFFVLALISVASAGHAQIGFPRPDLPAVRDLPGRVGGQIGDLTEDMTGRAEALVADRLDQVRGLVRAHPDVLERTPQGDLAVRGEIVAWAPSPEVVASAESQGFTVLRRTRMDDLDAEVVVLSPPKGQSARAALKALQKIDPQGVYDYNHIYLGSGGASGDSDGPIRGAGGGRVGLIDSGVDAGHPVFRGVVIVQKGFGGGAAPDAHGTATAALMMARGDGSGQSATGAALYVADVYAGRPTGGSTEAIIGALSWLSREKVAVINISLVGPSNGPLKAATAAMVRRGHLLVAAVGNDGPAAKPLYPAAFDGVIGVTGVDARRKVLIEAGRGPQVDFAAPGADIVSAGVGGKRVGVRGTSYAAPLVAGKLSRRMSVPDTAAAARAVAELTAQAQDLGRAGRDPVYGAGLVEGDIFNKKQ